MLAIFGELYICAAHQGPRGHHLHGSSDRSYTTDDSKVLQPLECITNLLDMLISRHCSGTCAERFGTETTSMKHKMDTERPVERSWWRNGSWAKEQIGDDRNCQTKQCHGIV